MKRIPIIIAGGKGERFWPLSRQNRPKQILPIVTEKALIVDTYERLSGFDDFFIVANKNLCDGFRGVLPQNVNYIEEPFGRDTAAAIGLACIKLQEKYTDCIMIIEPSDAYHKDLETYRTEIKRACDFAEHQDTIVAIGIKPTAPHTGYGYIKKGIHLLEEIYTVDKFVEKPNLLTAKKFVKDENYFWNVGKFIVKCSLMLEKIEKYMPKLHDALVKIKNSKFDSRVLYDEFSKLEKISIDVGVMEQSKKTVVLTSSMHWDDIGDFNAISRVRVPDSNGNFISKEVKMIDSNNNIILSDKLVALIGVEDLIVVDTPDALLVCKREDSQKIKELVQGLDEKYR